MHVATIWRHPVKSLGGELLDAAEVGPGGVEGDRAWGVLDPATGLVLTARREPSLLLLGAAHRPEGRPSITTPDGTELADDDALSDWLGRRVLLQRASDGPGTFENPMDVDLTTGAEGDWLQWQSAGTTFHDGRSTVSLVSFTTLGSWDARRFRANLVLDVGTDPDAPTEDDLHGRVRVGAAVLQIRGPIDRCVMVTRPQPGLPADLDVLRRVIAERGNQVAVGGTVVTPGRVTVGDPVTASPPG